MIANAALKSRSSTYEFLHMAFLHITSVNEFSSRELPLKRFGMTMRRENP